MEDEDSDIDSEREYEEEPEVSFIPENQVHKSVENKVLSEESNIITSDSPEGNETSLGESEANLIYDSNLEVTDDKDSGSSTSSEEEQPLIN